MSDGVWQSLSSTFLLVSAIVVVALLEAVPHTTAIEHPVAAAIELVITAVKHLVPAVKLLIDEVVVLPGAAELEVLAAEVSDCIVQWAEVTPAKNSAIASSAPASFILATPCQTEA